MQKAQTQPNTDAENLRLDNAHAVEVATLKSRLSTVELQLKKLERRLQAFQESGLSPASVPPAGAPDQALPADTVHAAPSTGLAERPRAAQAGTHTASLVVSQEPPATLAEAMPDAEPVAGVDVPPVVMADAVVAAAVLPAGQPLVTPQAARPAPEPHAQPLTVPAGEGTATEQPLAAAQTATPSPNTTALDTTAHHTKAPAGSQQSAKAASPPVQAPAPRPPAKSLAERLPEPVRQLILGGNALVKVGALLLFLGLAFLLRYAAERVTVPIELRYAGVAATGALLLGLGWLLRHKRLSYALILQGTGIGVFYLTTLAGMKIHGLIPPGPGFGFLFAVALLSAVLAVRQNSQVMAVIAVLEGFAAPVLASTGSNQPVGLFTYLAILDLGIFLMAWKKSWRVLNLLGLACTLGLASGWGQRHYTPEQWLTVQPFLLFFVGLFSFIGVLFARHSLRQMDDDATQSLGSRAAQALVRVGRVDSSLVFGTPLSAFALQYLLVRHLEFGPAFAALGFGFFYLLLAWRVKGWREPGLSLLAEAYVIIGVMFGTLAIPLGLEGRWTGAAWALEAAAMFWLGVRQQRSYARLVSFVVLAGAAYKLLQETALDGAASMPLLVGSTIGPVLLAVSALTIWAIHHKAQRNTGDTPAPAGTLATVEAAAVSCLPWLGMAAVNLLPWLWFQPYVAAAGSATLGVLLFVLLQRMPLPGWTHLPTALQFLGLGSFLFTLHTGSSDGAALANGWKAGLAAAWIALSHLGTVFWSMRIEQKQAHARNASPSWSVLNQIGLLAGVGLLHLALLFVVSLADAAWIWPLMATLVMGLALRFQHLSLAGLSAAFQLASAALFLLQGNPSPDVQPFLHRDFGTALSLAAAGLVCAYGLRSSASRFASAGLKDREATVLSGPLLVWGLGWWWSAWSQDLWLLTQVPMTADGVSPWRHFYPAAILLLTLGTSLLMAGVAKWRGWVQLGTLTLLQQGALVLSALLAWRFGVADAGLADELASFRPSSHGGWLLWPAALAWHLLLLRRPPPTHMPERILPVLHVAGFWLFLLLASLECHAVLQTLAAPASSWPVLGSLAPAALALWFVASQRWSQKWPVQAMPRAYLGIASLPVVLWLMVWVWFSNITSAGHAAPLPYLPVLNPLELMQWMAVLVVVLWWRKVTQLEAVRPLLANVPAALPRLGLAFYALALITGAVLRSCHHFANIPWQTQALLASRLTQASLSLTWAVCGVLAMVIGNRRHSRSAWVAGAALLAAVVLKLFMVDLADHGGLYRIISFIGVGVLLLGVGYFAPVPTKAADASSTPQPEPGLLHEKSA